MSKLRLALGVCAALVLARNAPAAVLPTPDHIVVVIEENRSDTDVYGSADFPYFNQLANNQTVVPAAKFTNWGGITHPSQPNYIAMFAGQTFGIADDSVHAFSTFANASNIGAKLINNGKSFISYSEGLPSVGSQLATSGKYARKHNAAANWQDNSIAAANRIPTTSNQPMTAFPSDFSTLPTLSLVAPDLNNDGHDTSDTTCDTWLKNNLKAYAEWAVNNNSLLVVTWDEDEGSGKIASVIAGANVLAGSYSEATSHYGLLRTIEAMYGLSHDTTNTQNAATISDIFVAPEPAAPLALVGLTIGASIRRRRRHTRDCRA